MENQTLYLRKISLFSYTESPRFQYISRLLLMDILGFEVLFFYDRKSFQNAEGVKINYSKTKISEKELQIIPHGLLDEKGIFPQTSLGKLIEKQIKYVSEPTFDLFSASFYLISRYEEYLPFVEDTHGRFSAKNSLAYRLGFLQTPIVHEWCNAMITNILAVNNNYIFQLKNIYTYLPTYDVDQAFSYLHKGTFRTFGGLIKDVFNIERWKTLLRISTDPYNTFEKLDALHHKYSLSPIYFFLLGDWNTFDKSINFQNTDFQNIIKNTANKLPIGIHPSYASNNDFSILQKEKNRLEKITENEVIRSRQHFLKLRFPSTYHTLISANIKEDFTMGYADAIGFRASIAIPFLWYDLHNEKITNLKIHSFQIMDVTLKEYLKLSPPEAVEATVNIIENTRNAHGIFTTLWHNSSFDTSWKEWKNTYEEIINRAV